MNEKKKSRLDFLLGNESWSVLLICLTQDLPFLIIRLYILAVSYNSIQNNYTIYFFLIKNFILVLLEIYRVISLYCEESLQNKTKVNPEDYIPSNINEELSKKK